MPSFLSHKAAISSEFTTRPSMYLPFLQALIPMGDQAAEMAAKRSKRPRPAQPEPNSTTDSSDNTDRDEHKNSSSAERNERSERIRGLDANAATHLPSEWRLTQNFLSFGIFRFFRASNCRTRDETNKHFSHPCRSVKSVAMTDCFCASLRLIQLRN